MALTDPVPSQAIDVFKRNMEDSDRFVSQTSGTVTNRTGKTMRPLPVISDDIEQQITDLTADINAAKSDLYPIVKFRFLVDTYEITNRNELGDTATGETYRYIGATLPFNVTPATNPVGNPDFVQVIQTDHNNLTNRNAVGAHDEIYIRTATLAEAIVEDAPTGTRYVITDLEGARYDVVSGSDTGGYYLPAMPSGRKLKKLHSNIENALEYGSLSDVATNTLLLQAAINKGGDIVIYNEVTVNAVNLQSNTRIAFAKNGKLVGVQGSKVFIGTGLSNIELINPKIEGVFTGTPSLLEHAIDLTNCNNVNIHSPRFNNIGGNAIRFDRCTDTDVYDLNVDTCGYLGYITINCIRDRLHSGYVKDAKDPFSVQSKGGEDSLIDNMVVENPHSCGVIMNTNVEGGVSYLQKRGRIGRVTIKGESSATPIGTKGGVFAQMQDGFVSEVYMTGNTKLPQFAIGGTTDNLQVGKITVEANTSLGIDGAAGVGTVVIQSLICKGNQDRAAKFQSGKISILGGEINENGLANVPNLEFTDWENLIIQGVNFVRASAGSARNNIKLGTSSGTGIISGNTFTRNGQPDILTATGEFRVDCPNVDVVGNRNCFVQVTVGWVAEFDIQNGLIIENGYVRTSAPTTGTWVVGDVIKRSDPSIGNPSRWVCVAVPNTFAATGVLS